MATEKAPGPERGKSGGVGGTGLYDAPTCAIHLSQVQREGVWEAIWAELQMALRKRIGSEASPSAAVLDSQSVKSTEKAA
jgi:hypothetical protein